MCYFNYTYTLNQKHFKCLYKHFTGLEQMYVSVQSKEKYIMFWLSVLRLKGISHGFSFCLYVLLIGKLRKHCIYL